MLKFCFSVITFSLVDRFTSYSHTMLRWSRHLHWYATLWPSNGRETFICVEQLWCKKFCLFNHARVSSWSQPVLRNECDCLLIKLKVLFLFLIIRIKWLVCFWTLTGYFWMPTGYFWTLTGLEMLFSTVDNFHVLFQAIYFN